MATFVRASFVLAFFAAFAVMGLQAGVPTPALLVSLGGAAGILVVSTVYSLTQPGRDRESARKLLDPRRLHKPTELLISALLGYAQWGFAAVAVLTVAKSFLADGRFEWGALVFVALSSAARWAGNKLQQGIGPWSSMRLRLIGLTHRSVEFAIVADASTGAAPIEAQAEYSRVIRHGENSSRSELLWRSALTLAPAQRTANRVEFPLQIAMPDDFPQELEFDERAWRRRWSIKVKVAAGQYFNFSFAVPRGQAARS